MAGNRFFEVSRSVFALLVVSSACISLCGRATAQTASRTPAGSSVVQGKVADPSRAPIAGARITAVLEGQGLESSTVSDQNGEFVLSLAPGNYRLRVVVEGFQEVA